MTDIPFITVAPDELGEPAEKIMCPHFGKMPPIQYGTSQTLLPDGTLSEPKPDRLLGYYKHDDKVFLATIDGKLMEKREMLEKLAAIVMS